jgi:hypothetical protein
MPIIEEKDVHQYRCPWDSFSPCIGSQCMAWSVYGPPYDRRRTNNIIQTPDGERPEGDPKPPEGDGWEKDGVEYSVGYHQSAKRGLPKGREQMWMRPVLRTKGFCTRSGSNAFYGDDEVPF